MQRIKAWRSPPPPEVASEQSAEKTVPQISDDKVTQDDAPPALTRDNVVIGANTPVPDTSIATEKESEGKAEHGTELGQPAASNSVTVKGENAEGTHVEEDETKYPKGWVLGILTFGLCLALFVVSPSSGRSYKVLMTYQLPLPRSP